MNFCKKVPGILFAKHCFYYVLAVCQEGGVKKGGTWKILRVSDQRYGGQGHP